LRKRGVFVSASGVRSIWLRNNLANFKQRLKALEAQVNEQGIILNDAQIAALEKKRYDDEACGEIETAHPGYLGSQDTFYVGHLKGVSRVYQQTFIDTYSKVVCAKLYTSKTPITAADLLNDRVLPLFEEHQLPMLRILTDRGTEYCGKAESHDYQLYLAINDIEHTKTKAKSPQTNGSLANASVNISSIHLMLYKNSWIYGCITIIITELTKVKCAAEKRLCKHLSTVNRLGRRKI